MLGLTKTSLFTFVCRAITHLLDPSLFYTGNYICNDIYIFIRNKNLFLSYRRKKAPVCIHNGRWDQTVLGQLNILFRTLNIFLKTRYFSYIKFENSIQSNITICGKVYCVLNNISLNLMPGCYDQLHEKSAGRLQVGGVWGWHEPSTYLNGHLIVGSLLWSY